MSLAQMDHHYETDTFKKLTALESRNARIWTMYMLTSQGHEPENIYPTLPYWQSVKNIHITYICSQILTNEPQVFMPNPYSASIYGCIR